MQVKKINNNVENLKSVINAKNKNKIERQNYKFKKRMTIIIFFFIIISLALLYILAPISNIKEVVVNGNYYLSDEEIIEYSQIIIDEDKYLFERNSEIRSNILENVFIEDAYVEHLKNNVITIEVKEKKLAGYVTNDNIELYCTTGESIELSENNYNLISYCPEFTSFEGSAIDNVVKNMDLLSQETINSISEIFPYETTYDDNMIKMLMSNGKYIFLSPNSIEVLDNYFELSKVLTDSDECLYIDELSGGVFSSACPWDIEVEQEFDDEGNVIENNIE